MHAVAGNPSMIGDRYELGPIVGTGAFATVHQATDLRLDSAVAIKVLAENWAADPSVCERFGREATLLRRVRSSHRNAPLAEVFDIDQTTDGRPYFVMSFADRGTLASRWTVGEPWSVDKVIPVLNTLADGLHALHSAGVVHRDIKPSNLLYVTQTEALGGEQLLIGDLGLAKDTLTATSDLTVAGGTPGYMAPEQRYPDSKITAAADVFSATVVISELLTGLRGPAGVAELPAPWRSEFARGLHESPHERHQSIAEWRTALLALLRPSNAATLLSSPARTPPPPNPVLATRSADFAPHAESQSGRDVGGKADVSPLRGKHRVALMAAISIVLIVLLGVVMLVVVSTNGTDRIEGPTVARVGQAVFLRPDLPDDAASHVWIVDGQRVNDSDLELTPQSEGSIAVTLEITKTNGDIETDRHVVVVGSS